MCEVYNRLKQLGVVRGKKCIWDGKCDKSTIPPDDFIPQTQCIVATTAQLLTTSIKEDSAEELIEKYRDSQ